MYTPTRGRSTRPPSAADGSALPPPTAERRRMIRCPADVVHCLPHLATLEQEAVWVLGLDSRHRLLTTQHVALGTVNQAQVVGRDVFRELVRRNCAAFIAVHNHPSGDSTPSPQDDKLTEVLKKGGKLLGIPLLDHVIIVREGFHSYAAAGQLQYDQEVEEVE